MFKAIGAFAHLILSFSLISSGCFRHWSPRLHSTCNSKKPLRPMPRRSSRQSEVVLGRRKQLRQVVCKTEKDTKATAPRQRTVAVLLCRESFGQDSRQEGYPADLHSRGNVADSPHTVACCGCETDFSFSRACENDQLAETEALQTCWS